MRSGLQVWGIALANGDVLAVFPVCAKHAAWTKDSDFYTAPGTRTFRVRARAWVRRILRRCEQRGTGCIECALRDGRAPIVTNGAPFGTVKVSELETEGALA